MSGPVKRYPTGPITPHGGYHLLRDRIPQVALRSYDDSIVFNLMGALAIADRTMPERVELKEMRGLIPPWKMVDQKGASQDGTTFVDALYDPMDVMLGVKAVGRNPAKLREVVRDLIASIDTKRQCELSFFTHHLGRWWAPVRWSKVPDDAFAPVQTSTQELKLNLRADDAFWQSYPSVGQFRFTYDDDADNFDRLTAEGDPVTGWSFLYGGAGSGVAYTNGSELTTNFTGARSVIARRDDYTASIDNVVTEIELGSSPSWSWPPNTYVDVWHRMNNTGTIGRDGIRWRMGSVHPWMDWTITVSSFNAGVETVIRTFPLFWWWPATPGEKFTFITGTGTDPRTYKVLRNNAPVGEVKESGTGSLIGSSYRKAGWGVSSASGTLRPMALRHWNVGDSHTTAQEGFIERVNVGDQPMWDRFTCFGPGTFYMGNGPGSTEFVRFGPLLTNQVMQVRTDPRKRGVIDMTAIPPSAQEIAMHAVAQQDFFSFLFGSSIRTAPQATNSIFGILPPQGNPYALLKGRFSNPIPERSPAEPVRSYFTKVKIEGGNSDSQIIAAGTPLRRLPY